MASILNLEEPVPVPMEPPPEVRLIVDADTLMAEDVDIVPADVSVAELIPVTFALKVIVPEFVVSKTMSCALMVPVVDVVVKLPATVKLKVAFALEAPVPRFTESGSDTNTDPTSARNVRLVASTLNRLLAS